MALFQAVVIGLLALIITPGYLFYFDVTPKVVVLLAGASAVLLFPAETGTARSPVLRSASRWLAALLLLNLLSLTFSTALSANPALSAFGTNWRRFGSVIQAAVLLFAWSIVAHTAGRPDRIRLILRAIAAASGISAIYGISQYAGWDPILPAAAYHIGEGIWTIVRPPGTMGYVSYFATWLLYAVFLGIALAGMESSLFWRRFAFFAAALSLGAMLLTGTRAAILGLFVGALWAWWAWWAARRRRATSAVPVVNLPHFGRILAVALVLSAATAGFYFSSPGLKLRSRARWFVEDPWGGNRLNLWRDSLRMASSRLPLGYGSEIFTAAFPPFESKALARAYPDFAHESPHNIFLDALISQGLPGLLILCGLCLLPFRGASGGSPHSWVRAALVAGIVSQQFTVFTVPTALIFYITIALAIGLSPEPAGNPGTQPARLPRNWRFTLAAAPVSVALIYLAARFTLADHALERTRQRVQSGDLGSAAAHYNQYQGWRLPGTTADLWYSRSLFALAQRTPDPAIRFQAVAQSGAAAVRATRVAEDPFNAWYNMALLYASQNDSQRTEQSLRAAIAAKPNWFKPHWTLAQLLRLESRLDEAEREAALAAELNAGKNPEVAETLAAIRAQRAPAPSEHK